ncbi:zinc-dependent alcohol dehydrogenase [Galbitalea soli]|uniref:Zinc-binding dehydrogenase n=1 Tax=Galbitalea soli TaxID=1268042 RepID=A0A7C9TSD8_9MICO|nr:zinc-binding dehydrogenase [Galbitalea soli]NEM91822.1 zinc-binding dehydrogenase [Galbitalea soli]NYJ29345.1 L-iditol 2-dehydrogenase [Galbitalea soli]
MKALQYAEQGVARVAELEIPAIGPDEVLVAARAVGVCHSDIDLLEGRYIIPFHYPLIPGHEWSGEVVKVGDRVTEWAPGDRVVGECVIGADHFGFSISGAAADFFVAKPSWLHRLPDELSYTMGALVEPFSVAYYAIVRAGGVDASDTVVVLGAGPVGLAVTAASATMGAVTVVVEPSEDRRAAALSLGAAHAVHPDDIAALLETITGGRGADLVVEASGRPAVMAQALELVAFQGRVAYIGIDVGREASAKLGLIQSKELRITGSIGSPGVWPQTLRFLANSKLDLTPLVTQHFTVDEALDALDAAHHPETTIKAHIEFDATLPA